MQNNTGQGGNLAGPSTNGSGRMRKSLVSAVVIGAVTVLLGLFVLLLDLFGQHQDPAIADGFRLALGSLVATIAVDRALAAQQARNGRS